MWETWETNKGQDGTRFGISLSMHKIKREGTERNEDLGARVRIERKRNV